MLINQNIDCVQAESLDNTSLLARLLIAQQRAREILVSYRIPRRNILEMARLSRKLISNSDIRASFLENLIELQSHGVEAKSRNLLAEAEMTSSGLLSTAASEATSLRKNGPQIGSIAVKPTNVLTIKTGEYGKSNFSETSKGFFESLNIKQV